MDSFCQLFDRLVAREDNLFVTVKNFEAVQIVLQEHRGYIPGTQMNGSCFQGKVREQWTNESIS